MACGGRLDDDERDSTLGLDGNQERQAETSPRSLTYPGSEATREPADVLLYEDLLLKRRNELRAELPAHCFLLKNACFGVY